MDIDIYKLIEIIPSWDDYVEECRQNYKNMKLKNAGRNYEEMIGIEREDV